jgi:hypothetical protein
MHRPLQVPARKTRLKLSDDRLPRGRVTPPEGYIRGRQRCPDEQQGCLCAEEELLEMIISRVQLKRLLACLLFALVSSFARPVLISRLQRARWCLADR